MNGNDANIILFYFIKAKKKYFKKILRYTNCPSCDTKFAPCIVSGRPILEPQFWVCGSCKHRAIEQEIASRISCPLCHMPVR